MFETTHSTLLEKLLFGLGILKDVSMPVVDVGDTPIGGRKEAVIPAWETFRQGLSDGK